MDSMSGENESKGVIDQPTDQAGNPKNMQNQLEKELDCIRNVGQQLFGGKNDGVQIAYDLDAVTKPTPT